ncbi:helix-turn-helix domain-containing protein [Bradyrhizobium sp. ORS 111]|uniref:helix-turn-helix domain-containing protein n=1 Tax=Bradyrhizobium sp. ORS 111 TaxID=1685958 RepID=UPI00388F2AF1
MLRIIEFFDEIRRPARANEVAERLGFPQSSTSVLLNSLVGLGYLDFDGRSKTYLPSIRIAVLATWRDTGCFRDGSMLAELDRLEAESGLAACLSTRSGIFVRYLNVVQHVRPGDVHITLSAKRYAVRSAAGIVLIADLSEAEIKRLIHRTRAEGDRAIADLSGREVIARVCWAKQHGYYFSAGLVDPRSGAVAIGLPKSITGGWQEMALSLAGRLELVDSKLKEHVRLLRHSIERLIRTTER